MKKVFNFFWKQKQVIVLTSIIVAIWIILENKYSVLKENEDIIVLIAIILMVVIIGSIVIWAFRHDRKEKERLYDKYGYDEINIIWKYNENESFDFEKFSNKVYDFLLKIQHNSYIFLGEMDKLAYSIKDYNKDLKKISKVKEKGLDDYLSLAIKVMDIISIYYDDNGNRRKTPIIENKGGEYYGELIKKRTKVNKKYEIRRKDNLYRLIIYDKVWLKNEKESTKRLDNSIEMWKEDKSLNHITDNLDYAIKIAEDYFK